MNLLFIALAGLGIAWLAKKDHTASASTLPATWRPPAGSKVELFPPPIAGTGMAQLKRTSWHVAADASGAQAGTFNLVQNAADPNDWLVSFKNDGAAGGGGILAYSQTPRGGLIAQAAAAGL